MQPKFIHSARDLITPRAAVRKGFLEQAMEKSRLAEPFLEQAKQLSAQLAKAAKVKDLARLTNITDSLLTACALSEKAKSHLSEQELADALEQLLSKIHQEAGPAWRDEIVSRFLLTKGDSLGGRMRNITGFKAGQLFGSHLEKALRKLKVSFETKQQPETGKYQSITWPNRILLFDKTSPLVKKNIDAILLNASGANRTISQRLTKKGYYLACGELKGGIDPAGADEHWKTARSALQRIRQKIKPKNIFFVGAAIEESMAEEIFRQLQDGSLDHAANLTSRRQIDDLASWLISL